MDHTNTTENSTSVLTDPFSTDRASFRVAVYVPPATGNDSYFAFYSAKIDKAGHVKEFQLVFKKAYTALVVEEGGGGLGGGGTGTTGGGGGGQVDSTQDLGEEKLVQFQLSPTAKTTASSSSSSSDTRRWTLWTVWERNKETHLRYCHLTLPHLGLASDIGPSSPPPSSPLLSSPSSNQNHHRQEMVQIGGGGHFSRRGEDRIYDHLGERWMTAISRPRESAAVFSLVLKTMMAYNNSNTSNNNNEPTVMEKSVQQVYVDHIFYPGRFSNRVIALAYLAYERALEDAAVGVDGGSSQHLMLQRPKRFSSTITSSIAEGGGVTDSTLEFEDVTVLKSMVLELVGSHLSSSSSMIESDYFPPSLSPGYQMALEAEYARFLDTCIQLHADENMPMGLCVAVPSRRVGGGGGAGPVILVSKRGGLSVYRPADVSEVAAIHIDAAIGIAAATNNNNASADVATATASSMFDLSAVSSAYASSSAAIFLATTSISSHSSSSTTTTRIIGSHYSLFDPAPFTVLPSTVLASTFPLFSDRQLRLDIHALADAVSRLYVGVSHPHAFPRLVATLGAKWALPSYLALESFVTELFDAHFKTQDNNNNGEEELEHEGNVLCVIERDVLVRFILDLKELEDFPALVQCILGILLDKTNNNASGDSEAIEEAADLAMQYDPGSAGRFSTYLSSLFVNGFQSIVMCRARLASLIVSVLVVLTSIPGEHNNTVSMMVELGVSLDTLAQLINLYHSYYMLDVVVCKDRAAVNGGGDSSKSAKLSPSRGTQSMMMDLGTDEGSIIFGVAGGRRGAGELIDTEPLVINLIQHHYLLDINFNAGHLPTLLTEGVIRLIKRLGLVSCSVGGNSSSSITGSKAKGKAVATTSTTTSISTGGITYTTDFIVTPHLILFLKRMLLYRNFTTMHHLLECIPRIAVSPALAYLWGRCLMMEARVTGGDSKLWGESSSWFSKIGPSFGKDWEG